VFEVVPVEDYTIAGVTKEAVQLGRWKVTDYGTVVFINLKLELFFVNLENIFSQVAPKVRRLLKSTKEDLDIPANNICIGDRYVIIWHLKKIVCLKTSRKRNEYQIETLSPSDPLFLHKVSNTTITTFNSFSVLSDVEQL
jgi:hypothetical protein